MERVNKKEMKRRVRPGISLFPKEEEVEKPSYFQKREKPQPLRKEQ